MPLSIQKFLTFDGYWFHLLGYPSIRSPTLIEWHPPFAEPRDEAAQGSQTADEPLYALDVAYRAHIGDSRDFFRVGLDAAFGHNVSKQLPLRNPKNIFLGIQSDIEPSEVHECCGQVCDQVASLGCFDHYVINIDGDCWFQPLSLIGLFERVNLVGEALLHAPLVGGTSVLQAERHGYIIVQTIWSDERSRQLVGLFNHDLVIA